MLKSEKGVSAVEFALVAPLLFVLTFGIVEFSIMLFDKAVITNASREGARAAVVYHTAPDTKTYSAIPATEVIQIVEDYARGHLISLGSGSARLNTVVSYVDAEGAPSAEGVSKGDVTVTANYPYSFLVFSNLITLLDGTFTGTFNLVGTTVMRME